MLRNFPVLLLPVAALFGCGQGEWQPSGVGAITDEGGDPTALPIDLSGDMVMGGDPGAPPAGTTLEAGADAAPYVFYLFYADGGPPPGMTVCSGTPPKYSCSFGSSVEDCQKKVQVYLDKWYGDFNLVFTITKPTSGRFFSEVITGDGAWCGMSGGVGGIAPFSCSNMGGSTCYAFLCASQAKACAVIISQEQAHLVGLEHTTSTRDLLYPSVCSSCDGFENKDNGVSGGMCRSTQNSYMMMKDRLGTWDSSMGSKPGPFTPACTEMNPPTVMITEPADGAKVPADFTVKATGMDDCAVKSAHIDVEPQNLQADSMGAGPFQWDLTGISGKQTITVTVTDTAGKTTSTMITINGSGGGGGGSGGSGSGGSGQGGSGQGGSGGGPVGQVSGGTCAVAPVDPVSGLPLCAVAAFAVRRRRRS